MYHSGNMDMSREKLLSRIKTILVQDFSPKYHSPLVEQGASFEMWSIPRIVPTPIPIVNDLSTSTVIYNNSGASSHGGVDREKKDNATKSLGVATMVGVSLATTFVASRDDRVQLWNSDLDNLVALVGDATLTQVYLAWRDLYIARTQPKTVGKLGLGASGVGLGACLYLGTSAALPVVGLTCSGCFLLWKYLTDKTRDKLDEEERFRILISQLNNSVEPTAPEQELSHPPPPYSVD